MGIHVKRIEKEFMLKTLLDRDIPVTVHGDRKQAGFFITQYSDSEIFLRPKDNPVVEFIKNEAVRLFGSIDTTYVTLSSTVLRRDDKSLIIENTDNFCKNPERKYERINTKNMKVSFMLKGNTIELNFPKTDTFAIIEEPPKSDLFDATSIADLIKSFKEHLGKISTNNTIVMFREKPPSTPEENLITRIGKILWIPDTKGELPGENSPLSHLVISQNELTRFFESTGVAQGMCIVKSHPCFIRNIKTTLLLKFTARYCIMNMLSATSMRQMINLLIRLLESISFITRTSFPRY
ncbi:MAG: hypothetical protein P8107_05735 [Spirochaetia bacterium]